MAAAATATTGYRSLSETTLGLVEAVGVGGSIVTFGLGVGVGVGSGEGVVVGALVGVG